jgi:hypothetical protein
MADLYYNQQSFSYGKLGKLMTARDKLIFHNRGAKVFKNYRPSVQGPAIKRKGTKYVKEAKDSSKKVRLIKFIFSEIDSFVLEFGDLYVRFYQSDNMIMNTSQAITGITKANPAVVTYTGSDTYANGDQVYISGVAGMTEVNGLRFTVANVNTGANTFQLSGINSTNYTTYTSGGILEEPYEIVSPYLEADLPYIKYAQIGDIMYLVHPDYKPYKLTRVANTNWTLAAVDYQLGPCQDFNEGATTITLSGTLTSGGASTWTASASLFVASDVGSVWAIAKSTDKTIVGYAKMTGYTSATVATFTNQSDLTSVTVAATINWKYPSWSATYGYPRAIAFHEQRLVFGGSDEQPLTIWGSVTGGAYENFDIGTAADDDAIIFDLVGRVNTIQWLVSDSSFLVAGTYGGLAFIGSGSDSTPLTATNIKARVGSSFGSSTIQGVQVNTSLLYNHSNTKNLYKATYDDVTLQYIANDLNDYNSDILSEGTTYTDVVEQPDSAILCVSDGDLKILNYDETQGVEGQALMGWYEYILDGDIESVATLPTTGDDRIWISVKRTINSVTKRYIEYFENTDEIAFLDSYIKYSGSATRTLTGLSHLEAKTVSVYGDGSYFGTYTVASGSITIPTTKSAVEEAIIGLPYDADLEIMPINIPIPSTGGTTQSLKTRVADVTLLLYQTLGVQIGETFDSLLPVEIRNVSTTMTSAPDLFANDYPEWRYFNFNGDWTKQATICMRNSLPFPSTILSLMARIEVNNR